MSDQSNPYGSEIQQTTHYGENGYDVVLIDEPAEGIRRITLNRPDKRNALNHQLRGEVLHALETGDSDPAVKVMIIRGAGKCFSAGYDLGGGNVGQNYPFHTAGGDSQWPRHVVESWMRIWDLSKPVIAQVHGYCLAGGSELATGCDLVYVADNAQIGYPAVRFGVPDMQFHPWLVGMRKAMEMLLTGDALSGEKSGDRFDQRECGPVGMVAARLDPGQLHQGRHALAGRRCRLHQAGGDLHGLFAGGIGARKHLGKLPQGIPVARLALQHLAQVADGGLRILGALVGYHGESQVTGDARAVVVAELQQALELLGRVVPVTIALQQVRQQAQGVHVVLVAPQRPA